jgi:hypothetical protein
VDGSDGSGGAVGLAQGVAEITEREEDGWRACGR